MRRKVAAAEEGDATAAEQAGHLLETVLLPRHDDEAQVGVIEAGSDAGAEGCEGIAAFSSPPLEVLIWAALPIAMARLYLAGAFEKIESSARKIIAAVAEGDMLRTQLSILRRLAKHDPYNVINLQQQVASAVIQRGKYALS